MPGMPKHIEKGPFAETLEAEWRSTLSRAASLLAIRAWESCDDPSESLIDHLPGFTEEQRTHVREHWFGEPEQQFWVDWDGEARLDQRITAAGLKNLLEVSLGLGTDEPVDRFIRAIASTSGTTERVALKELRSAAEDTVEVHIADDQLELRRDVTVALFWVCDMPLFEFYVSWNEVQAVGIVTTPAVDTAMFNVRSRPALQEAAKKEWPGAHLVVQSETDGSGSRIFTAIVDEYETVLAHRRRAAERG